MIKKKKDFTFLKGLELVSQLGFSVSLPITAGAILGSKLDERWGLKPRMTLSFLFLGVFIGILNLYLLIKEQTKDATH